MVNLQCSMMTEKAVGLLCRLIEVPRVSREEKAAADLLQNYMQGELGLEVQRMGNNIWSVQPGFDAAKQTVSMLVIDKKKLRISQSGLPQMVLDQQPWYTKWMKVPIVKAKVGPRIMTFMADANVFEVLPLKTECKVVISGLYITEIKSARGGIPQVPKKKTLRDRISGVLTKKS